MIEIGKNILNIFIGSLNIFKMFLTFWYIELFFKWKNYEVSKICFGFPYLLNKMYDIFNIFMFDHAGVIFVRNFVLEIINTFSPSCSITISDRLNFF